LFVLLLGLLFVMGLAAAALVFLRSALAALPASHGGVETAAKPKLWRSASGAKAGPSVLGAERKFSNVFH
jgi:hypothetical protein